MELSLPQHTHRRDGHGEETSSRGWIPPTLRESPQYTLKLSPWQLYGRRSRRGLPTSTVTNGGRAHPPPPRSSSSSPRPRWPPRPRGAETDSGLDAVPGPPPPLQNRRSPLREPASTAAAARKRARPPASPERRPPAPLPHTAARGDVLVGSHVLQHLDLREPPPLSCAK